MNTSASLAAPPFEVSTIMTLPSEDIIAKEASHQLFFCDICRVTDKVARDVTRVPTQGSALVSCLQKQTLKGRTCLHVVNRKEGKKT